MGRESMAEDLDPGRVRSREETTLIFRLQSPKVLWAQSAQRLQERAASDSSRAPACVNQTTS